MKNFIEGEYLKLSNNALTSSAKYNIINNIIQIKLDEPSLRNVNQDLSIDIKQYLNYLIENAESGSIGYDSIEVRKVNEIVSRLCSSERLIYIDYFIRQLQKSSFEIEISKFQKLKTKIILQQITSKNEFYKPKNWWLLCLYLPLYNITCLFLVLIIIGLLIALALLPAPFDFMSLLSFEIKYQNISLDNFTNHLLNVFSFFVGFETDFKLIPTNTFTAIVFIIVKVLVFLYIVNYLFNKLVEYLKN